MAKSCVGPSNMAERISHLCICSHSMSVKVALCSIKWSSRAKTMKSRRGLAILHPVLVKGRILSVDAIFSCRAWCATVHAYQGYYFIPIKENNPAVLRDLTEFFADKGIDRREFQHHKEVKKGHGRLEIRESWGSHADERMVRARVDWDRTSLYDPKNGQRKR